MKIVLVCGHYGCGKTNLALNLAARYAERGRTALIDMDVVNPYFRSSDYKAIPALQTVRVISPTSAGTTIDAPCLSPEIFAAFDGGYDTAIFDVGGDDAGATSVGQFAARIREADPDYEMLYVINRYRAGVATPDLAAEILAEIEAASRLKATGIVNNSHLCSLTTAEDVLCTADYARAVAERCGLPLVGTAVERRLLDGHDWDQPIAVDVIVSTPWAGEETGFTPTDTECQ